MDCLVSRDRQEDGGTNVAIPEFESWPAAPHCAELPASQQLAADPSCTCVGCATVDHVCVDNKVNAWFYSLAGSCAALGNNVISGQGWDSTGRTRTGGVRDPAPVQRITVGDGGDKGYGGAEGSEEGDDGDAGYDGDIHNREEEEGDPGDGGDPGPGEE